MKLLWATRQMREFDCRLSSGRSHPIAASSLTFGAQWMWLLRSDFRVRTLEGICDDWPIGYTELKKPF